jgi:hypothetical protein
MPLGLASEQVNLVQSNGCLRSFEGNGDLAARIRPRIGLKRPLSLNRRSANSTNSLDALLRVVEYNIAGTNIRQRLPVGNATPVSSSQGRPQEPQVSLRFKRLRLVHPPISTNHCVPRPHMTKAYEDVSRINEPLDETNGSRRLADLRHREVSQQRRRNNGLIDRGPASDGALLSQACG